jgi:hypothetical protein
MADDPVCCGFPMTVQEYDKDEDTYLYMCQENCNHLVSFTDDDEVWK